MHKNSGSKDDNSDAYARWGNFALWAVAAVAVISIVGAMLMGILSSFK